MKVSRGTVVGLDLDPALGHEQGGYRPCVVVSADAVTAALRYPMLAVVPLTSTPGLGALYPVLAPTPANGLTAPSTALVDQVRSVDKGRVRRAYGQLAPGDLAVLDAGLRAFLGLV